MRRMSTNAMPCYRLTHFIRLEKVANDAWRLHGASADHWEGALTTRSQTVITSALRSIDFENGIAVTQNSVYTFPPMPYGGQ